jgi:hypothetical protein
MLDSRERRRADRRRPASSQTPQILLAASGPLHEDMAKPGCQDVMHRLCKSLIPVVGTLSAPLAARGESCPACCALYLYQSTWPAPGVRAQSSSLPDVEEALARSLCLAHSRRVSPAPVSSSRCEDYFSTLQARRCCPPRYLAELLPRHVSARVIVITSAHLSHSSRTAC